MDRFMIIAGAVALGVLVGFLRSRLTAFKYRKLYYKFHCAFIARRAWYVTSRGDIHEIRVYKREGKLVTAHGGIGFTYKGWQTMDRYSVFYRYDKARLHSLLEKNELLSIENSKMHQILKSKNIRYWGNPNGEN